MSDNQVKISQNGKNYFQLDLPSSGCFACLHKKTQKIDQKRCG